MKNYSMIFIYSLSFMIFNLTGCAGNSSLPPPTETPIADKGTVDSYYLQPGDNLDIKFFYNPELNENVTIRPDGKISLQLIDEINAAGITPSQLDDKITEAYSSQLRQSTVTVILKSFGGQKVYVGGEVYFPQVIEMVGRVNALQAIFDAGGFKDDAKLSSVIILSKGSDNRPIAKKVNLENAIKGELPENEYLLKPFDMVYVPKTNLAKADQFITHLYNFIPPQIYLSFLYELHNEPTDYDRGIIETLE